MDYCIKTSNGYDVTGPESDGEIEVQKYGECFDPSLYLTKQDLLKMLARFDPDSSRQWCLTDADLDKAREAAAEKADGREG